MQNGNDVFTIPDLDTPAEFHVERLQYSHFLKICVIGLSGAGKTHFLLDSPKEIGWFGGGETIGKGFEDKFPQAPLKLRPKSPSDAFSDLVKTLQAAREGRFEIKTFACDGITGILNDFRKKHAQGDALSVSNVNKAIDQYLISQLTHYEFPCHIVFSAQLANERAANDMGNVDANSAVVGVRPDGHPKLKNPWDLIFRLTYDPVNKTHAAVVEKTRFEKHFPKRAVIDDFSWKHLQAILGRPADNPPTKEELSDLYNRAGKPDTTFKAWLQNQGLLTGEKMTDKEAINAADLLEDIVHANSLREQVRVA